MFATCFCYNDSGLGSAMLALFVCFEGNGVENEVQNEFELKMHSELNFSQWTLNEICTQGF